MKQIISIMMFAVFLNVYAGEINRCKDENGNDVFSDRPCSPESKKTVVREDSVTTNSTSKSDNKSVLINSQRDFDGFVKSLRITKMSEVMRGVRKDSFHGLNIENLFSAKSINLEDWGSGNNKLEFLVNVSNEFKAFAVMYRVEADGVGSHAFLDLPTDEVIRTMKANGFGLPQVDDGMNKWKWRNNNADCEFMYERSLHNPEKKFMYQCTSM